MRLAHKHALRSLAADAMIEALRIAWIDSHRLIQECMISAFGSLHPRLDIVPFPSIKTCLEAGLSGKVDMIVYQFYEPDADLTQNVSALHKAGEGCPIVLFADARDGSKLKWIRAALRNGANGFICTRTSSLATAFASLLFVHAGGTFVPVELLPAERERVPEVRPRMAVVSLTQRQLTILARVKRGMSNKAIAQQLGMSESAVKVDIRTIMRRMGAANRTQAAFLAMETPISGEEGDPALRRPVGEEDIDGRVT